MPFVTYVQPDGSQQKIDVPAGENVMRGALYNNVAGIIGECGGGLSCATCHCYVDAAWASKTGEPSEMEREMLDNAASELKPTSRLSCQIEMTNDLDGLVIHVPEKQYD